MSVRLFDRSRPPIDKACGEGLMPDGVACLEELDIDAGNLGRPFTGIRYVDRELEAIGHFSDGFGVGIRRTRLQSALAERAEQLGASLHWSCSVTGIGPRTVQSSQGSFHADWIVGADGLNSPVRSWLGIRVRHGRPRFGLRRHFEIAPWTDLVEVHWGDDCEVYVTPVDDRQVGVAVLRGNQRALFPELLNKFPAVRSRLKNAPASSRYRGSGPFWSQPDKIASGNVALVGDAAGYLDAITGEGLSLAFHQSKALIEALTDGDLGSYPAAVRRLSRFPEALIRALLFIERRPPLRRRLVRTLANDSELFDRLLAVHSRQLSPGELGIGNAARLLLGMTPLG